VDAMNRLKGLAAETSPGDLAEPVKTEQTLAPAPEAGIAGAPDVFEAFVQTTFDAIPSSPNLTAENLVAENVAVVRDLPGAPNSPSQSKPPGADIKVGRLFLTQSPIAAAGVEEVMKTPQAQAISRMKAVFEDQFRMLAADKDRFHAIMGRIYDTNYGYDEAEALRQRGLAGDFRWLPGVQFVPDASVSGRNGIYAEGPPPAIYMSDRLLNNPTEAAKSFIRGVGFHLDSLTDDPNISMLDGFSDSTGYYPGSDDARGNEGEIFRAALAGEPVPFSDAESERILWVVINGSLVPTLVL
jgi:hypothetical protein